MEQRDRWQEDIARWREGRVRCHTCWNLLTVCHCHCHGHRTEIEIGLEQLEHFANNGT